MPLASSRDGLVVLSSENPGPRPYSSPMELTGYRDRFPILTGTTYLINHSLGAMPAATEERLAEYARIWRTRGIRAWGEGWWTMPLEVGDQIGRIIGAEPGTTVMHQNVAVAEAIVLSCFRPVDPSRNRIVYEAENFPSVRYLYQAQPELEVVVCDSEAEIVEAIDERTLLVPISHVLFKSAEIQEVGPIVKRAHEAGARVVLDCYQSAGIVPLAVGELGVDFAVGGSVKWLCGGPGNGWLYVRPDLVDAARADARRVAGARVAVLVRAGAALRRRCRPIPDRDAQRSGAVRRDVRLLADRGDRGRADPGQLAPSDRVADPARRRGRVRGAFAARPVPSRRHGDRRGPRLRGGAQGAGRAQRSL